MLRQVFGDLRTAAEGLVSVGVVDGTVVSVTSSLTRGTAQPQPAQLSREDAERIARADGGFGDDVEAVAELVALPVVEGARSAYEVVLLGEDADAVTSYVDAVTGEVLLAEDLVDHASDDPSWRVFPANPPADYSSTDTRATWCAAGAVPGCTEIVRDPAFDRPWDVLASGVPTFTTSAAPRAPARPARTAPAGRSRCAPTPRRRRATTAAPGPTRGTRPTATPRRWTARRRPTSRRPW